MTGHEENVAHIEHAHARIMQIVGAMPVHLSMQVTALVDAMTSALDQYPDKLAGEMAKHLLCARLAVDNAHNVQSYAASINAILKAKGSK